MDRNILTIGGWDPSGCAGIAADLKTVMAFDAYGAGVITTITAQNTQTVTSVDPVPEKVIRAQLEAVVTDIEIHAVKVGLLAKAWIVELVASLIREFHLSNVVVDPVLRSTTGFELAEQAIAEAYTKKLFPIAEVITPNVDEASRLSGVRAKDVDSMKEAAVRLHSFGVKNVIITGGHLETAADVLYDGSEHHVFETQKIPNTSARGLGCTFASILAVHLSREQSLPVAIQSAKNYIERALVHPFQIGKGRGPLNHKLPS